MSCAYYASRRFKWQPRVPSFLAGLRADSSPWVTIWVNVYNTGGWVVDSVEPQLLHGGAVILADEDLNTASLRMYNEDIDPGKYLVRVEETGHAGEAKNPFYRRMRDLVKPSKDPWKTFSAIAVSSVNVRAQNLRARINARD